MLSTPHDICCRHGVKAYAAFCVLSFALVAASILTMTAPAVAQCSDPTLVFAHDFQNWPGSSITALCGPSADQIGLEAFPTCWSTYVSPLLSDVTIDTNTRLDTTVTELSFSILFNARGAPFSGPARFLSSFDGSGPVVAGQAVFDLVDGRMRFLTDGESVFSDGTITADSDWHQAGFTFANGTVRFYLDGQPFGSDKVMPSVTAVVAQTYDWHLVEDVAAGPEALRNYDEAYLWTRQLSDTEMNDFAPPVIDRICEVPVEFPTLQSAIDAAEDDIDPDTVLVSPGIYTGLGNTYIVIERNVVLLSSHGAAATWIDCQGTSSAPVQGMYIRAVSVDIDGRTVVDGFTIKNGYKTLGAGMAISAPPFNIATAPTIRNVVLTGNSAVQGAGLYIDRADPTLINVTVSGNSTFFSPTMPQQGGGICIKNSDPTLIDVTFSNNTALNAGGGMYTGGGGSPTLVNVTFSGNSAAKGGAMLYDTGIMPISTLTNVIFTGNEAFEAGGGIYTDIDANLSLVNVMFFDNCGGSTGGGGMFNRTSDLELLNVSFSGNSTGPVGSGGAMYNSANSEVSIVNAVCWGNTAQTGNEIFNSTSTVTIAHSLIAGSGGSGGGWDTSVGTDGGNNIDANPLFTDQPSGNLRLGIGSPAINTGDNTAPNLTATDLDDNARVLAGTVDMGAYEAQFPNAVAAPSPLVFDEVAGNVTTCDTICVVNNGGTALTIAGIGGCSSPPFSIDSTMTAHTLASGDTTKIAVCVTPTTADADSCTVTIVSNAMNSPTSVPVQVAVVTSAGSENISKPFRIVSVAPNPFNPSMTVHFTLPAAMEVTAEIWSVTGARVRALTNGKQFAPGENQLTWDGTTDRGSRAASGVYFIRVKTRLGVRVARAVMLK